MGCCHCSKRTSNSNNNNDYPSFLIAFPTMVENSNKENEELNQENKEENNEKFDEQNQSNNTEEKFQNLFKSGDDDDDYSKYFDNKKNVDPFVFKDTQKNNDLESLENIDYNEKSKNEYRTKTIDV